MPPLHAGAQRAEGAIAVSLIIAPTVELRTVAVTERVADRGGPVTIRTMRPATARKVPFVALLAECGECERAERIADAMDEVAGARWERAVAYQLGVARLTGTDATPRLLLRSEILVAAGT